MEEESDDSAGETNVADDNTESDVVQEEIYFDGVEVAEDQVNNSSRDDEEVIRMIKEKLANMNWRKRKYFKTKPSMKV